MHHHHLFYKKPPPPPPLAGKSEELDVFEATRYFSGALTDSGGGARGGRGYASAYGEDETRAPPRRAQRSASSDERRPGGRSGGGGSAAAVQMKTAEIPKKKLHKQPSSPGAKLVSYLNSLFYQAKSRRKLKCLNLVRNTPEDVDDDDDDEVPEKGRVFMQRERRRSIGDSPFGPTSSKFCGGSSFATPHFHPNPVVPGGVRRPEKDYRLHGISKRPDEIRERGRENRWVLNRNAAGDDDRLQANRQPDRYLQEHGLAAPLMVSRGRLKSFGRRRDAADHEDEDDLSDSSSDLFELKIYGQSKWNGNGVMTSDGLPVFATTDIEAFKRETAISSN